MNLGWAKPLPLIFMAAAPLLLMWAPARAFLGATVAKLPSTTRSLSETLLRRRRSGSGVTAGGRRLSCGTAVEKLEGRGDGGRRKVIVITGPTATGKSSIALALCKSLGGEIVSCDSVQVYKDVHIGCNKPSDQDTREVRHHLVDIASLDQTFTAGNFVDRAQEAIDDILSRGRVPVVVGGTMMYVQWLVHGKPDAPKKDPVVAQAVATELLPFQEREDWDGALQILAAANETRASSLCRNDWYRLSRSLEVLRGPNGEEAFTGLRTPLNEKYDFRSFFIVGDRERLFRRIEVRCEEMLMRGLLTETADLLVKGTLDPASPAGRAIGYRQAIDFLNQEARLGGWGGIQEKGGKGEDEAAGADPNTRFMTFYKTFTAKTRQYSGEQMKWFRSKKGRDFSWQAWNLGGPIEEGRVAGSKAPRQQRQDGSDANERDASLPSHVSRAGDGVGWKDVVASIANSFQLSPEAFDDELDGEYQASLRSENEKRARDMKNFIPGVSLLGDRETLWGLVQGTKELASRVGEAQLERQAGVEVEVEEGVKGWHAGSR